MKKRYEPIDPDLEVIEDLKKQGIKVTATQGKIHYVEMELADLVAVEAITGLKFKEVKK